MSAKKRAGKKAKGNRTLKRLKRLFWALAIIAALLAAGLWSLPRLNAYQENGEARLTGLKAPARIVRDAKAMPYIYAAGLRDAVMAQGYAMAQDRMFQMQLGRMSVAGRLCELAGEKARGLDIRMRTIGLYRVAAKHEKMLDPAERDFLQAFADGVNAYLTQHAGDLPWSFALAGIKPAPWRVVDSLAIYHYLSWSTSANLKAEIIAQMLVDRLGREKALEIFPLNLHPEDPPDTAPAAAPVAPAARLGLADDPTILAYAQGLGIRWGSNNWVVAGEGGAKPILANDPHLSPKILPGIMYPCAIITDKIRAVGVTMPGIPGILIGRNQYVAVGSTNSYGDVQDLYVETIDPQDPTHYLEGERSIPFEVISETLKIKDAGAPDGFRTEQVNIRLSRRGPVVSGVLKGMRTDKVMSLRWAPAETMGPFLGLRELIQCRSVDDLQAVIAKIGNLLFNFVAADVKGNIAFRAAGKLPIRAAGDGTIPHVVDGSGDNWQGWIPFDQMPHVGNPERGWVGTCNHKTVPRDYPYYYSSYFAPTYRYRRMAQLLDAPGVKSPDDHWAFQRDDLNLLARRLTPSMVKALAGDPGTKVLADILAAWDHHDRAEAAAPLVFQIVFLRFAEEVYKDELGPKLTKLMLETWYFWQQRLAKMAEAGQWSWFDDTTTPDVKEGAKELWVRAGKRALAELAPALGSDPRAWQWGRAHRLVLVHPIRREGFGVELIGGGSSPMGGSGETLYRGSYPPSKLFEIDNAAALRMVVDLNDNDKVMAVVPGGVTGLLFSAHLTDQLGHYLNGGKVYWWFSDKAIAEHAKTTLVLKP